MDLVVECYKKTKRFPKPEIFGLASQLQRAAVSIPANIAEGREHQYPKVFLKHLSIAYGSLAELETHIIIAERLGYVGNGAAEGLLATASEIGKVLNGLRRSLENSQQGPVCRDQKIN